MKYHILFSSLLAFYNFIKKAFSQNTETCTETPSDSVDLKFGVEDSNINELREILNKWIFIIKLQFYTFYTLSFVAY